LAAIEKFVSDFPSSPQLNSAKREIFKLTLKQWPSDRKRVLDAAARVVGPPPEANRVPDYQFIARELFTAGVFLEEAEEYAAKSIQSSEKKRYVESIKNSYAESKRPLPSDETIDKRYVSELAAYRTTLGRIYLKKGRVAEGEKILQEAYEADPLLGQAAIGLAEIAEKNGNDAAALKYLSAAALTAGWDVADAHGRFETVYRKTHNGALAGADVLLDARYRELYPKPVKVEAYRPSPSRTDRMVLAEMYTGAG
jgi:tetratricopeptide (TPR) repeat protein